jgi:hypothetical protein
LNERSVFSLPEVKAEFAKYTLLKQYTDTVPKEYYPTEELKVWTVDRGEDDARENSKFQRQRFNEAQLPLYVVIEPNGDDFKEVARYPAAVISDKADFIRFLQIHASKGDSSEVVRSQ